MEEAEADAELGRALATVAGRVTHKHQDDGLGVALDIFCVAASIALIPTGVAGLAILGGIAGGVLLAMNGRAYILEMEEEESVAGNFKHKYEILRVVATIAALPDALYSGAIAIREFNELREMREVDMATAEAASRMGSRTSNASRASRYGQIAERAHLRAQIRMQQITASIKLELAPRAAAIGSAGLLVREEILEDSSLLNQLVKRLSIHPVAIKK